MSCKKFKRISNLPFIDFIRYMIAGITLPFINVRTVTFWNVFERGLLCSPRLPLFDKHTVKLYCEILLHLKM